MLIARSTESEPARQLEFLKAENEIVSRFKLRISKQRRVHASGPTSAAREPDKRGDQGERHGRFGDGDAVDDIGEVGEADGEEHLVSIVDLVLEVWLAIEVTSPARRLRVGVAVEDVTWSS